MTPALRVTSFALFVLSLISFAWFGLELISYILLPIFDAPSLAGRPSAKQSNYLWNVGLFGLFFVQHIIMASFTFKRLMRQIYPLYPIFERYVFNMVSFLLYRTIIRWSLISNTEIFRIPKAIYALEAIGLLFFTLSVLQMFSNMLVPFSLKDIMESPQLTFEVEPNGKKTGLLAKGVYGLCRNPMYFGLIMMFIGASHIITVDRLIFCAVHIIGIIAGVQRE